MPVARISFAGSALSDLAGIQEWYGEEGVPEVGDRFVSEIFERVEAARLAFGPCHENCADAAMRMCLVDAVAVGLPVRRQPDDQSNRNDPKKDANCTAFPQWALPESIPTLVQERPWLYNKREG